MPNAVKFFKIISMKLILLCGAIITVLVAAVFLFLPSDEVIVVGNGATTGSAIATSTAVSSTLLSVPEAPTSSQAALSYATNSASASFSDIGPQQPLVNPPTVMKGVYMTESSAGYAPKVNYIIDLANKTEINAVVIDIKDYSGYVSYRTTVPATKETGAEGEIRIAQPNALLKKFHDAGIYVVGRITVMQDPVLAKAHPEWALINKTTGKTWTDNNGLAWMDPAAEPVWEYNAAIANDAIARGFDEVQFDYVRFASDGDLTNIGYPYWDGKTAKHTVIKNFFAYLRGNLPEAKLSADVFGLTTVDTDDLGIGQVIEDAYKYFDYVSPMVYPSHYAPGFLGYANPAKYPYEVIKYSMDHALARLKAGEEVTENVSSTSATSTATVTVNVPYRAKLRPWLQDFDLGATYDATMVKKEMQATYDALLNFISTPPSMITATSTLIEAPGSSNADYGGWLLWDPANIYTEGALNSK